MTLLALDRVTCRRGGRLLFKRLDFALAAGEGVRLAGPNGSGKSSLLRLAAGLLEPVTGTVTRTVAGTLADEGIALDSERRLGDALRFWASASRLEPAVEAFGLGDLLAVPVRLLSNGQLRRARLARVMASGAPLWLLDEPLNGLDDDGVARLDWAIAAHRGRGGAVLAASHVALAGEWRTLELATAGEPRTLKSAR